ncbi:ABC transporter permease [Rhizobium sp. BR 314]
MTRTFLHSFEPATASPITGATVDLEVSDIEDAGIREVLQTPGAAYSAWPILDALLAPTGVGTPFIFKEPLGQAREVKVALSGLFGRFVARAYLERYFNFSIFAHLGSRTIDLDRRRRIRDKGLPETAVILRHSFRNAILPVITVGALLFGKLLAGAVLSEQIFTIPGSGKLIVDAVVNRDYAVAQGVVLCTAIGFIAMNLIADILYVLLNPLMRAAL